LWLERQGVADKISEFSEGDVVGAMRRLAILQENGDKRGLNKDVNV